MDKSPMVMYTLTTVDIVGHVAEWLRRGLQILPSQFDSGRGLQKIGCFIFLKKVCCVYSSVAQLVEQLTVNQLVAGSSPARGAILTSLIQTFCIFQNL